MKSPSDNGGRILILHTTDKEFLESIGVKSYDPELFRESQNERVRVWILRGVAALQMGGIIAALIWTSR
jgi:hypothetical protein